MKGNKGKNNGIIDGVQYFKCGRKKEYCTNEFAKINIIDSGVVRVTVGDLVHVKKFDCNGKVRFIGSVDDQKGIWYGIEFYKQKVKITVLSRTEYILNVQITTAYL